MKLTWEILDLHLAHPWAVSRTAPAHKEQVLIVQLTDGDGTVGRGETAPIRRYGESIASVIAFLRRVDPDALSFSDPAGSFAAVEKLSAADKAAKCALDVALLDGAGKRAGKAVYDLLELGFSEGRHVTSFTVGIDRPEVIARKTMLAADYPILKLKVGVAQDRANLAALREAAPHKRLRVDANEGWKTREEALENIERLASDRHIEFVEQPLPAATSAKDWAWLKARSPLPIIGDESYHGPEEAELAAECFHGVNVKLVKMGGISGTLAALQAARRAGLKTMLGCMIETSLLISAGAQLSELCDYLDLDGNVLITNDPFHGVTNTRGVLSFAQTPERFGIRAGPRT